MKKTHHKGHEGGMVAEAGVGQRTGPLNSSQAGLSLPEDKTHFRL